MGGGRVPIFMSVAKGYKRVLTNGDSLTFQGEIPHRPEALLETPIKFLAIIHYDAPDHEHAEE